MSSNLGWIFGVAPLPTVAAASASSLSASESVAPPAALASATGTSNSAVAVTGVIGSADNAAGAGAAENAAVDISTNLGWIFGYAGFADHTFGGIGEAFGAGCNVSPTAAAAEAVASAFNVGQGALAGFAGATAAAGDATISYGTVAFAQEASGVALAQRVVGGISSSASTASAAALDATISNTPVPVSAFAHAQVAAASAKAKKARAHGKKHKVRTSIDFIKHQLTPSEAPITASTITVAPTYNGLHNSTHTNEGWLFGVAGQAAGTFHLSGISRPTEQLCPITVTSPPGSSIPSAYRGTIAGTVSGLGGSLSYKVQVYRHIDIDYDMHVYGDIDTAGNFTINLASVPPIPGEWRLAVVLRSTSGGQIGSKYPSVKTYHGLRMDRYEITNTVTFIESQTARANNTFAFSIPVLARQRIRLVDTLNGDALLADYTETTGCVRSYLLEADQPGFGTSLTEQCYVQDQGAALAAMIAAGEKDTATQMVDGLLLMQTIGGGNDGGFIYSANHLLPAYGDAVYRTGAHATALYALLKYILAVHSRTVYRSAAQRALTWLETQRATSGPLEGLYLGGSGSYSSEIAAVRRVNDDLDVAGATTEHNFAAWHVLKLASRLFGEPYTTRANNLRDVMLSVLWQPSLQRFARSYQLSGVDLAESLELRTLGAIWLIAVGEELTARQLVTDIKLSQYFDVLSLGGGG